MTLPKPCHANSRFRNEAESHPRAVSRRTEPRSEWSLRGGKVLCNLRAIDLDRLIAGLSLTAGGVIGVMVARVLS
mgnify:CR=1 FL=1